MAKLKFDMEEFNQWLLNRPHCIRMLARRFPPDRLYQLHSTKHRVTMVGYNEDGTLTVAVTGQFNQTAFDRIVFGISPTDLRECDLPPSDEPIGTALVEPKEIDRFINMMRPHLAARRAEMEEDEPHA